MIGQRCVEFRSRNSPPIGLDLFGSFHPRCGNLAQPSHSGFVYLLVCSQNLFPSRCHTLTPPSRTPAATRCRLARSLPVPGAASDKLCELLSPTSDLGGFGTNITVNGERYHFHRRCSQNNSPVLKNKSSREKNFVFDEEPQHIPCFIQKCIFGN